MTDQYTSILEVAKTLKEVKSPWPEPKLPCNLLIKERKSTDYPTNDPPWSLNRDHGPIGCLLIKEIKFRLPYKRPSILFK